MDGVSCGVVVGVGVECWWDCSSEVVVGYGGMKVD